MRHLVEVDAIAAHREATRRNSRARWDARRTAGDRSGTTPRRGETRSCPCGCGRSVYLEPWRILAGDPGYYSASCWSRHRWQTGTANIRGMIGPHWSRGRVRHWHGRWAFLRGGGRPRTASAAQVALVRTLKASNPKLGTRAIAERTGLSRWQVRAILNRAS